MSRNEFTLDRQARRVTGALTLLTLAFVATPSSADTLLMPTRDYLMSTSEVVWGMTTQATSTPFVLDYGDGSAQQLGNVSDPSYIAFTHTYALAGTFTVSLCVGPSPTVPGCTTPNELATVSVDVYDGGALTAANLRGLNVNRAIQDGLRYLWTSQQNRAAGMSGNTTYWAGFNNSATALVVLAFENHGYVLPNNNTAPTGIYERFIVQRGLNYLAENSPLVTLTLQGGTRNPCVGTAPAAEYTSFGNCTGLQAGDGDPGYSTALVALPFAGSNALSRTFSGLASGANSGYPNGRTYGEVLQRLSNTIAWGQIDTGGNPWSAGPGQGGWHYQLCNNCQDTSDGSTVGWDVLALLDAAAAGVTVPAWVKTEFAIVLPAHTNTSGSFDYTADGNSASGDWDNIAKAGVGLEGTAWLGSGPGNFDDFIDTNFNSGMNSCSMASHIGCSYDMYNAFKGLKLHNIATLPNVPRAAGPGPIPANDWHAYYIDWLVANQTSPTSTAGGEWSTMGFSCCYGNTDMNAAVAELILSPVALIAPDPTLFSTVGLAPSVAENTPRTAHTVTATATSSGGGPIPGVTVTFQVMSGPNIGKNGSGVTNGSGQATFTYTDTAAMGPWAPPGVQNTDTIQAFIGSNGSNVVTKYWVLRCDANNDTAVNNADLVIIRNSVGQVPSTYDPRDGNKDGRINIADYRYCQLRFSPALPPPS